MNIFGSVARFSKPRLGTRILVSLLSLALLFATWPEKLSAYQDAQAPAQAAQAPRREGRRVAFRRLDVGLQTDGPGSPEDEASDVRQVRHSARLHLCYRAGVEELGEEPKADQECGRNECDPHKHKYQQNGANPIARIGDQKRAHHRGDRTARAQVWNCGMGIGCDLGQRSHQPASIVENKITPCTHRVFDLGTEGP